MRQTSVKFNYGGVQGNSYTQPIRATTTNVVNHPPPPTYSVSQQPIKVHQTTVPHTVPTQNQEIKLKGFQTVNTEPPRETTQKLQANNNFVNYDNFPEAEAEQFTPGCCGKGSEGIVYESHEKTQSFC